MFPPVQDLAADSAAVRLALGNPVRFTPFGETDPKRKLPYATWQTVYGAPENKLTDTPDDDTWGVQIDVYGDDQPKVRAAAQALRDAFEPHGQVVSWNGESREEETRLFRYSFTIELMTAR